MRSGTAFLQQTAPPTLFVSELNPELNFEPNLSPSCELPILYLYCLKLNVTYGDICDDVTYSNTLYFKKSCDQNIPYLEGGGSQALGKKKQAYVRFLHSNTLVEDMYIVEFTSLGYCEMLY